MHAHSDAPGEVNASTDDQTAANTELSLSLCLTSVLEIKVKGG